MINFNLNDDISIKLTESGRNELLKTNHYFKEDSDGWSIWRGWELFRVFSHLFDVNNTEWQSKTHIGSARTITLPFEPDIKINNKELN